MKDEADERTTFLWNAVHVLERSVRVLEDQIHQMITFREQRDVHVAKVAKALEECAAQENVTSLQRAFSTYAEATQTLSTDTRELLVVRPEQQAMVELAQIQDWAIVPMKRLLEDRDKAIKTLKKLQKDVEDILQTNKEREKRQRLVQDQKRRVENVNSLVDLHMKRFEYFRVAKLKVMSELARAQLYYHCRGVEYFSAPCRMVPLVDPTAASEDIGLSLFRCQQLKP
ncbi:hypothetical protein, variant [Aphanomyces invadans]|uniref:Sorting nexin/Vps5-like C-terminal domain-containing protein n=1 Tax=Aphanomyces invadans TaxID=157072 RepID=A0A024TUI9_9STRA|nr:hypothetical protein, variant [Aphanomyces invadans]ETV97688.1 hypothetical protein, variant [Aphanomyces invadans]|eukprot:XP_008873897.1 hypothetical protein, variant [Aphanomyces invadans]